MAGFCDEPKNGFLDPGQQGDLQGHHRSVSYEQTRNSLWNNHFWGGARDGLRRVLPRVPGRMEQGGIMRRVTYLLFLLLLLPCGWVQAAELRFFVGAGLRQPVDRVVDLFQHRTGHAVLVDYDGSGRLLARITASGQGDLFMPGSLFYIEELEKQGRVHSWRPVVAHTPVVAVNRAKAGEITSFQDLARPGVRLALGDPKAMAFGKTALKILERSGLKDEILSNVVVYGATVKQLALYVAEGSVDASIIGRTDAFQFKDRVEMIPIPPQYFESETVAVAVLTTSTDIDAAVALRDFIASPEALAVFESFGFLPLGQKD